MAKTHSPLKSVITRMITMGVLAVFGLGVTACSPAVGSPEWCTQMKEKPKGDWTINEAGDFAKNCIL